MKLIYLYAIVILVPFQGFCQSVFIHKFHSGAEASLKIVISDSLSESYGADCSFKKVSQLPDSIKIRLVGELFKYINDTTTCSNAIYNLSNTYASNRFPVSKKYNLQINALILINYIAFSSDAFMYSPYPLLYDNKKKVEISCQGKGMEYVISAYERWYKKIKVHGFANYQYPLMDRRYEWFGSQAKQKIFTSYPVWDNYYNCRDIN